jgi:hypothetical protein
MKILYLHIGTTKTGSSAIQAFCSTNRSQLAKKGFYYPKSLYKYPKIRPRRNGHFLFGALYDEDGNRLKEQENARFEEGMAKIVEYFAKYDNIILSDEGLFLASNLVKKNLWRLLKKHSETHGYTIRIITYLRRQDQFLMSRWNQHIKLNFSHNTWEDTLAYIMEKRRFVLQYAEKLDELSGYFGAENIIVRRYDRSSFPNGNIIADFLQILGLELTSEFVTAPDDDNVRLKGNTVEIKRIINSIPYLNPEEITYLRQILSDCSDEADSRYHFQMMSPDETKAFLSQFQEANDRVAREYIGDGQPLFGDKISSLPKWEHNNPAMMDDVIQFMATSLIYMRREVTQTNSELANMREELTKMQEAFNGVNAELARTNTELAKRKNEISDLKHKLKHPVQTVFQKK